MASVSLMNYCGEILRSYSIKNIKSGVVLMPGEKLCWHWTFSLKDAGSDLPYITKIHHGKSRAVLLKRMRGKSSIIEVTAEGSDSKEFFELISACAEEINGELPGAESSVNNSFVSRIWEIRRRLLSCLKWCVTLPIKMLSA